MVEKSLSYLSTEQMDGATAILNVIQFPADDGSQARLDFEQIRLDIEELDRELLRLAKGRFRSPGGWARQTATPLVRMRCISSQLASLSMAGLKVPAGHRRRWRDAEDARQELQSVLLATATSITRLSDPEIDAVERRELLKELTLHRARQRRTFAALLELHQVLTSG